MSKIQKDHLTPATAEPLPVALLAITRWFLSTSLQVIYFVLILEQHIPFRLRAPQTALDALAAVFDAHLAHRAAKGIGASIDGVGQDVVDGVVERQPPGNAAPLRRPMARDGQRNALISQPNVHLTNALEFGKLGEDQAQSFLDVLVRVLLDPVAPSPHIACRDTEKQ